jgi:hypothetical protein
MAVKSNLVIDQGTDATFAFTVTDDNDEGIDLTDWVGVSQLRKTYTSNTQYSLDVTIANSVVTLSANSTFTGNIPAGRYVYDCYVTDPDGLKTRLVEGIMTVTPSVTH